MRSPKDSLLGFKKRRRHPVRRPECSDTLKLERDEERAMETWGVANAGGENSACGIPKAREERYLEGMKGSVVSSAAAGPHGVAES